MQVRYTKGRQLCYKDHIVNLPQDITEIARKLPHLPQELDMVVIQRDGVDLDHHVDFLCRREKVREALMYKIGHCPYYADLGEIDEEALQQLPENGSVARLIPTCHEGRQAQAPAVAQPGPAAAAAEPTDDDGVDEQFVGGILNLGGDNQTEVDGVRDGVASILNGGPPPMARYEQEIVCESL